MSQYDPRERNLSTGRKTLERLFPERQIILRSAERLQSLRVGIVGQIGMTAMAAVLAGWFGYSTYMVIEHQDILDAKQREVVEVRSAYKSLLAQVSVYRDRLAEVTEGLESNHASLLALSSPNSEIVAQELANGNHLGKMKEALRTGAGNQDAELDLAAASGMSALDLARERVLREREELRSRLGELETQLVSISPSSVIPVDPESLEVKVRQATIQRDLAQAEAERLRAEKSEAESRLADLENTQLMVYQRFANLAGNRIDEIEGALGETGLNLEDLLNSRDGANQGGPFIPLDAGDVGSETLNQTLGSLNENVARWSSLQTLAETLPLGLPLRDYRVSSYFGARSDPVNGRVSYHQGMDMAAPHKTPLVATGPGKVIYAGWRGRYGRLVEIDHGNGIKTRFGHLNKIFVRKGDMVERDTRIGLLGNSGRSTGPHVHYEVIVEGKPRNPSKFIKAGINVFKG